MNWVAWSIAIWGVAGWALAVLEAHRGDVLASRINKTKETV